MNIKITYRASDQVHEGIFPPTYTVQELANYLRLICNTYIILEMQPTSKKPNI
jgi:hypothetical protein